MSNLSKAVLFLFILTQLFVLTPTFADQQKDWSLELDNTFNSKYIWRGINIVDDWVWQPSLSAAYKWIAASVWGNMELADINEYPGYGSGEGKFTEFDYTAEFSHEWNKLAFALGVIHYTFPNTGADATTEIYWVIGLKFPLAPTLAVYRDIDEADGAYGTFSIEHEFENFYKPSDFLTLSATFSAAVSVGSDKYNEFYFDHDEWGFTDALFSAAVPVGLGEYFTLTPAVNYSVIIDSEIRDIVENDDNFFYGASLTISL